MLINVRWITENSPCDYFRPILSQSASALTNTIQKVANRCLDWLLRNSLEAALSMQWYRGIKLLNSWQLSPESSCIEKLFFAEVAKGKKKGWESLLPFYNDSKYELILSAIKNEVKAGNIETVLHLGESLEGIAFWDYIQLVNMAVFCRKKQMLHTLLGISLISFEASALFSDIIDFVKTLQGIFCPSFGLTSSKVTIGNNGVKLTLPSAFIRGYPTLSSAVATDKQVLGHILVGVALFSQLQQKKKESVSIKIFLDYLRKVKVACEAHLQAVFIQSIPAKNKNLIALLKPMISQCSSEFFVTAVTISATSGNEEIFRIIVSERKKISDLEFEMLSYAIAKAEQPTLFPVLWEYSPWLSSSYIQYKFRNPQPREVVDIIERLIEEKKCISSLFIEELLQNYIDLQESEVLLFLLENDEYISDLFKNVCPRLIFSAMQSAEVEGDRHVIIALYLQCKRHISFDRITRYISEHYLPWLPSIKLPMSPKICSGIQRRSRATSLLPLKV